MDDLIPSASELAATTDSARAHNAAANAKLKAAHASGLTTPEFLDLVDKGVAFRELIEPVIASMTAAANLGHNSATLPGETNELVTKLFESRGYTVRRLDTGDLVVSW